MWLIVVIIIVVFVILIVAIILLAIFLNKSISHDTNTYLKDHLSLNRSEYSVKTMFENLLIDVPCEKKVVITNLILPGLKDNDITTQIDSLIICPKGIIVVEVKDWDGIISGAIDEHDWSVQQHHQGNIHYHYNPVKQNFGHIYRIKSLIEKELKYNVHALPIYNMVIFYNGHLTTPIKYCYTLDSSRIYFMSLPDRLNDSKTKRIIELFKKYKNNPVSSNFKHNLDVIIKHHSNF